jgi:hypothetical protein
MLKYRIKKKIGVKNIKKKLMSIQVNISYSWSDSWDLNHHIKKITNLNSQPT